MNIIKTIKRYLWLIIASGIILVSENARAQGAILPGCAATGTCNLCEMLEVVVNIGKFILGTVGGLALLFFVYGGFIMLTSGGKEDWVKKGKETLINAAIGLVIVITAYIVVVFIINAVGGGAWGWEAKLKCES